MKTLTLIIFYFSLILAIANIGNAIDNNNVSAVTG